MAFKKGSKINLLVINVKTADNVLKEADNIWKWPMFLQLSTIFLPRTGPSRLNFNQIKPNKHPKVPLWESKYFFKKYLGQQIILSV